MASGYPIGQCSSRQTHCIQPLASRISWDSSHYFWGQVPCRALKRGLPVGTSRGPHGAVVLAVLWLSGSWQRHSSFPPPQGQSPPAAPRCLGQRSPWSHLVPTSSGVIAGDPEKLLRGRHAWLLLRVLTPNLEPSFHFPAGSWHPQGVRRRIAPAATVQPEAPSRTPPPAGTTSLYPL